MSLKEAPLPSRLSVLGAFVVLSMVESRLVPLLILLFGLLSSLGLGELWGAARSLKLFGPMALLIFAFNLVLVRSGPALLRIPYFPDITEGGLELGGSMALRSLLVVLASVSMLYGVPARRALSLLPRKLSGTAFSTFLSLRLFPIFVRDARDVLDAAEIRGISVKRGGFWRRVKSSAVMAFPLLNMAVERAMVLGEAMEARGFDARGLRVERDPLGIPQLVLSASAILAYALLPAFWIGPLAASLILSAGAAI